MRRSLAFLALGLSALAVAQYPGAAPVPKEYKKGFDSINARDARTIIEYLAGPETQGRGTGQPGFQKAAEFVARQFAAAGLKPLGENGTYFQYGTFYRPSVKDAILVTADNKAIDAASLSLSPVGKDIDVAAGIVVVRGGAMDRLSDEQVKSLDGKIVVSMLPAGDAAMGRQLRLSGAKAILTVVDRPTAFIPEASRRTLTPSTRRPTGMIARQSLSSLGPAAGAFFAQAQAGATMLALPREARLSAKGAIEEVRVPNVVGMIEGTDARLKGEYVGIGAHLDHEGVKNGVTYPGADDDASGSTAVVQIARAVAIGGLKPKRSLVFMTFFGEEMGLLGSKFLVDNPPVPLDKMVAEFQMDMVGRDSEGAQNGDSNRVDKKEENFDTMRLVGSKRISTELHETILDMNKYVGFKFKYDAEDVYTRSDHYNFAAKGIPIAFLFDGFHPDYHQPTDTVDKINFLKLTSAAKLYYLSLMKVANNPTAPVKDVKG